MRRHATCFVRRRASRLAASRRRAFNFVEMLIALSISAMLLTATLVALDASFRAYQQTTEVASTHTIGRLAMHRMLTLVRTGTEFGPFPLNPRDSIVQSDFIEFLTPQGEVMVIEWDEDAEALYIEFDGSRHLLLEGVVPQYDGDGDNVPPFTLEFVKGRVLYRATIDLTIRPDDNQDVEIEGDNANEFIRLVASAMPRDSAFGAE